MSEDTIDVPDVPHVPDRFACRGAASASWWRVVAVAQRHWYVLRRSPHRTFDVLLWPAVDSLLFASIAVYAASRQLSAGQQILAYTLTGMILWQVVYQSQIALATGFLEETWSKNLFNLMATPLREWEYAAGVALFGLAKLLAGVGVVASLAWVAYAFDVTALGLRMLPLVVLLLAVGWAIALFVIGLVLRFGSGAEALAWGLMFTVMPLSGVFYPTSALPGPLQPVASVLPTTHAFAAGRVLANGGETPWRELAIAAAGTVVLVAVALTFLTWMLRVFRARGYVTRYS
jgi:ABC-2 type transport system permease protein